MGGSGKDALGVGFDGSLKLESHVGRRTAAVSPTRRARRSKTDRFRSTGCRTHEVDASGRGSFCFRAPFPFSAPLALDRSGTPARQSLCSASCPADAKISLDIGFVWNLLLPPAARAIRSLGLAGFPMLGIASAGFSAFQILSAFTQCLHCGLTEAGLRATDHLRRWPLQQLSKFKAGVSGKGD